MQDYISGVAPPVREQTRAVPDPTPPDARPNPATVIHTEETTPTGPDKLKLTEQVEELSLDELAEMLRKVNLTLDLFEIAAEYSFEEEGKQIKIVVRNTNTGEIIRRIPPAEFVQNLRDMRDELLGVLINASV